MKKLILTGIAAFFFATMTLAQAPPQGVNYQAVAYDTKSSEIPGTDVSSLPIANQTIKVRFTIIQDQANGNEIYREEHTTTTDENGLFNLIIGKGFQLSTDDFPSIDWGTGLHFLKVDLDVSGSFNTMGTQQMWSVPYALYSEKSGSGVDQITNNGGTSITFTLENGDTIDIPLNGVSGTDGTDGADGISINWLGDFANAPTSPNINDGYYNSTAGISYVWNGTAWQIVAKDGSSGAAGTQGPIGPAGAQGPAGANGISINWLGDLANSPATPSLNDGYYNSTTGYSYVWNGSIWQIVARDGSNGVDGTNGVGITWLGDFASAPATPNENDGYYNSTDGVSYVWNGTAWQMIAKDGNDGADGNDGVDGTNGTNGLPGADGADGTDGIDGINMEWLGTYTTAPAGPTLNQAYYNSTDGVSYIWNGTSWEIVAQDGTGGAGPHNTLNQAYNEGGAGAGRTITANNGPVEINHTTTGTRGLIVTTNQASSIGVDVINSGTGVSLSGKNTAVNNQFPAVQAEILSNNIKIKAIFGNNKGAGYGVMGQIDVGATGSAGVYGSNLRTNGGHGVYGIGFNGVVGITNYSLGNAVYGENFDQLLPSGNGIGVAGKGYYGVLGEDRYSGLVPGAYGVFSNGNLGASGVKTFIIDHPTDPENKALRHFSIESNEVMNIYRGNAEFDTNGEATVTMPDYYDLININPSYNLTPIGGYAQLYIKEELQDGVFVIAGGQKGLKVSWTVYTERNDRFMQKHPENREVELDKREGQKGKYFMPQLYDQPENKGIFYRKTGIKDAQK